MKIRGIEIAISVLNYFPAVLGVIPLDIEVPEELAKTDWTPLEFVVTVLMSKGRSSGSIRVTSLEQDPMFRIDQNMIRDAVEELNRRIEAKRMELAAPPAEGSNG